MSVNDSVTESTKKGGKRKRISQDKKEENDKKGDEDVKEESRNDAADELKHSESEGSPQTRKKESPGKISRSPEKRTEVEEKKTRKRKLSSQSPDEKSEVKRKDNGDVVTKIAQDKLNFVTADYLKTVIKYVRHFPHRMLFKKFIFDFVSGS